MALFRGIQEYIALDANNITLVFDSVNISGNIFLYPPQGHPILYKYTLYVLPSTNTVRTEKETKSNILLSINVLFQCPICIYACMLNTYKCG